MLISLCLISLVGMHTYTSGITIMPFILLKYLFVLSQIVGSFLRKCYAYSDGRFLTLRNLPLAHPADH